MFQVNDTVLYGGQKLLHEELAYVLNIQPNDVPAFISEQLSKNA